MEMTRREFMKMVVALGLSTQLPAWLSEEPESKPIELVVMPDAHFGHIPAPPPPPPDSDLVAFLWGSGPSLYVCRDLHADNPIWEYIGEPQEPWNMDEVIGMTLLSGDLLTPPS